MKSLNRFKDIISVFI